MLNENTFLAYTTHMNGALLVEDSERIISYANNSFYECFAIQPEFDLKGQHCGELLQRALPFFEKPAAISDFVKKCHEEKLRRSIYPVKSADGRVFRLVYQPMYEKADYAGCIWQYQIQFKDDKINQNGINGFEILNNLNMAVLVINDQLEVEFINNHSAFVFGIETSDVLHKNFATIFKKKVPESFRIMFNRIRNGEPKVVLELFEPIPFVKRWFSITGTFHFHQTDQVYYIFNFEDITERKTQEIRQRERDKTFQLITENAADLICLHEKSGNILYCSPSIEQFGYTQDFLLFRNPLLIVHPDFRKNVMDAYQSIFKNNSSEARTVYQFRKKDGSYVWVEGIAKPIIEDGVVTHFHTITRNIDERVKMENALRSANQTILIRENELTALISSLDDVVMELDQNLIIQNFWTRNTQLWPLKPNDIVGCHIYKIPAFAGQTSLVELLMQTLKTGKQHSIEFVSPFDSRRWLSAKSSLIKDRMPGKNISLLVEDITARKRSEVESSNLLNKLNMITDNIQEIISIHDYENGLFEFISHSGTSLGYSDEELTGGNPFHLIHPEDIPAAKKYLELQRNNPNSQESISYRFRKRDGVYVWLETSATEMFDATKNRTYWLMISRNIDRKKKYEQEIELKNRIVHTVSFAQKTYLESNNLNASMQILIDEISEIVQAFTSGYFIEQYEHNSAILSTFIRELPPNISAKNISEKNRELYEQAFPPQKTKRKKSTSSTHVLPLNETLGMIPFVLRNANRMLGVISIITPIKQVEENYREKIQPLLDAAIAICEYHLNHTELENLKNVMLDKNRQLEAFLTSFEDCFLDIDEQFNIQHIWHTGEVAYLRKNKEELLHEDLEMFEDATIREQFRNAIRRVQNNGKAMSIEFSVRHQNELKWYRARINPVKQDKGIHASVLIHDISEIKASELLNEQQRNFYLHILDHVPADIVLFDNQHNYLYANPKAISNEIRRKWIIGKNDQQYLDKFHSITSEVVRVRRDQFQTVVQSKEILSYEEEILRPDKRSVWQLRKFVPIINDMGHVEQVIGYAVDITDIKKAERETHFALEKEKKLGQMKSQFVSTISHEFRTPLATIRSSIDLIGLESETCKDVDFVHQINHYLVQINEEIERIVSLMNDILLLGRFESGKTRFSPDFYNPSDAMIEILRTFPQNDKHLIQFDSAKNYRAIYIDKRLFTHVIQNIVNNAIKYSDRQPVSIDIVEDPNYTEFVIKDSGIGIPAEDLSHLFESFYRASNVQSYSGTGLGLVIVKNILDMHGALIHIDSVPGKGTTVYLRFNLNTKDARN